MYPQDKTTQNKKESQLMVWGHPTRDVCGCLVNSKETEAERGRSTLRAQQFGWTSEVGENMGLGAQQWQEGGSLVVEDTGLSLSGFTSMQFIAIGAARKGTVGQKVVNPLDPSPPLPIISPGSTRQPHSRKSGLMVDAAVCRQLRLLLHL